MRQPLGPSFRKKATEDLPSSSDAGRSDAPSATTGDILIDLYRQLHAEKKGYGRSSERLFQHIQPLMSELPPLRTILDYGCGQSRLIDWLARCNDARAIRYDPAIPKYAKLPKKKVDLIINTDVLEHVPDSDIDDLLARLATLSQHVYFQIATAPAGTILPNGENAHCTVRPAEWWKAKIKKYFPHVRSAPPKKVQDRCAFVTWEKSHTQKRRQAFSALRTYCADLKGKDCIVFGSAPNPSFGEEGYKDEPIVSCNGSAVTLYNQFGLAPDFSFLHGHVLDRDNEADEDIRSAMSHVPKLGKTVIFAPHASPLSMQLLEDKTDNTLIFDSGYQIALMRELLGSSFPRLDLSTGAMAVACTLFAGARSVKLVGFSFERKGHSYNAKNLHRNHITSDAALYALLILARYRITSTDPSVQMILTKILR